MKGTGTIDFENTCRISKLYLTQIKNLRTVQRYIIYQQLQWLLFKDPWILNDLTLSFCLSCLIDDCSFTD